jgi:hypothetical protein
VLKNNYHVYPFIPNTSKYSMQILQHFKASTCFLSMSRTIGSILKRKSLDGQHADTPAHVSVVVHSMGCRHGLLAPPVNGQRRRRFVDGSGRRSRRPELQIAGAHRWRPEALSSCAAVSLFLLERRLACVGLDQPL